MNSNKIKKIKIGIYDPYLDTLGGGERYILTVAESLILQGHQVNIFWSGDPDFVTKGAARFSLNLNNINIVPNIFNKNTSLLSRFKTLLGYDTIFYLSDGSLPFLFSKNNIVHFQVPFKFNFTLTEKLLNSIKFLFINTIICNSQFTSKVFTKTFNHHNKVLYPPVDVDKFKISKNKENIILSVGRFDNLLNSKRQDILIKAFSQLISNTSIKWKLVLAGGSKENPQTNQYLKKLLKESHNLPIEIIVNPSFDQLVDLYSKSKIYWHAAGYDVDQNLNPENTEHFGIVVVEAMSAGLIPIVVNKGGLPEIVSHQKNGFLWNSIEELIATTKILINSPDLQSKMSLKAIQTSKFFNKSVFTKNLLNIINQR